MNIDKLDEIGQTSIDLFGNPTNPLPSLHHLQEEVKEVMKEPLDVTEYADCLILLMGAFKRIGGTAEQLVQAAIDKVEVNKKRKWGKADENGVIKHIDEEI